MESKKSNRAKNYLEKKIFTWKKLNVNKNDDELDSIRWVAEKFWCEDVGRVGLPEICRSY